MGNHALFRKLRAHSASLAAPARPPRLAPVVVSHPFGEYRAVPIASMTGFGRAQGDVDGLTVTVEVRSVNHRGLDARISLPAGLGELEAEIQGQLKAALARGRVELRVALDAPNSRTPGPASSDELSRARREHERLEAIRSHLGLEDPVRLADVLAAMSAATSTPTGVATGATSCDPVAVRAIVFRAISALRESRGAEGEALRAEFQSRLETVLALVAAVDEAARHYAEQHRERLRTRVSELLGKLGAQPLDEGRLLQEVALQLDKADITEETVRARTHAEALLALFKGETADEGAVGKRVDFTLQELGREANTMASKSASAELTEIVVRLKTEIERMREQALNLE